MKIELTLTPDELDTILEALDCTDWGRQLKDKLEEALDE